ncbi:hypothetical protein FA13DRAFT_1799736 [Coprinellus micaceus]|uniref:Uncharacterized protein n=1 Tax=Coprinellus micaceus TaxID=71717 RepID=A0A4Y7SID8_COPMI|nr:hypothetical protein FA13DRAFT_1799736 [Coprinellus micaceus]
MTRDLQKKLSGQEGSGSKPADKVANEDSVTESETEPESPLPSAKGKALSKPLTSAKPTPASKAVPKPSTAHSSYCANCSYLQRAINDLQDALKETREDLHEAQKNRLS